MVADLVRIDEKSYAKIILCFPIVGSIKKMNQNYPWLMKNPIESIICFLEEVSAKTFRNITLSHCAKQRKPRDSFLVYFQVRYHDKNEN